MVSPPRKPKRCEKPQSCHGARSTGRRSSVRPQLRVLRHLGLAVGQRDGRQVVYELHDDHVAELLEQVVSHVEHVRLGLAGRHRAAEAAGV